MNIAPLSFKGQITIKTNYKNGPTKTEIISTTKKQDGELLRAASQNLLYIQANTELYRRDTYAKDTELFHKTLENIVGHKIEQPSTGTKLLSIGGKLSSDYESYNNKYDTTYNKIFYQDINTFSKAATSITVDLMNPNERFENALNTFDKIKEKTESIFGHTQSDQHFDAIAYKIKPEKYADVEKVLNTTLKILDKMYVPPYKTEICPIFANKEEAYTALIKGLMRAIGANYKEEKLPFDKNNNLTERDIRSIQYAVKYLHDVTPNLYK